MCLESTTKPTVRTHPSPTSYLQYITQLVSLMKAEGNPKRTQFMLLWGSSDKAWEPISCPLPVCSGGFQRITKERYSGDRTVLYKPDPTLISQLDVHALRKHRLLLSWVIEVKQSWQVKQVNTERKKLRWPLSQSHCTVLLSVLK